VADIVKRASPREQFAGIKSGSATFTDREVGRTKMEES
jgi:hypothetical protein